MHANRCIKAFILSSPRSGSTLLRLTLSKLKNVVALPETHFFAFLSNNKIKRITPAVIEAWVNYYTVQKWPIDHKELKKLLLSDASELPDILELSASYYVRNVLKLDIKDVYIIEKSPPHIFYTNQIIQYYPSAKLIYLIRDPRDVVASLKTCAWSTSNVIVNSRVWRNGIRAIKRESSYVLQYENLVADSDLALAQLCDYLEIEFNKHQVSMDTSDIVEEGNHTSSNSLKPISAKHIGKYHQKLSRPDCELQIIEHCCRREMKEFGYIASSVKRNIRFYKNYLPLYCQFLLNRI